MSDSPEMSAQNLGYRVQALVEETKLYMDKIERGYAKTRYALELILKVSSGLDKVGTLATIKQLAEKGLESNE